MTEPAPTCAAPLHDSARAYALGCRCHLSYLAHKRLHARWARRAAQFGGATTVDGVGTQRRLKALNAAGWSWPLLAQRLGRRPQSLQETVARASRVRVSTYLAVAELYDELELEPGPARLSALRAAEKGWPPPERWYGCDMDSPDAQPKAPEPVDLDPVVVERLVAGDYDAMAATKAERRAAVVRLREAGMNHAEIGRRIGCTDSHVDYLWRKCG